MPSKVREKIPLSEEALEELRLFREQFEIKWRIPLIIIPRGTELGIRKMSLNELKEIVNRYLPGAYTIDFKTRKHLVSLPRYIFYYIADMMGYHPTYVARQMYEGCTHASVIAAKDTINDAIDVGDKEVLKLYGAILDDVHKRLEDGEVVHDYKPSGAHT